MEFHIEPASPLAAGSAVPVHGTFFKVATKEENWNWFVSVLPELLKDPLKVGKHVVIYNMEITCICDSFQRALEFASFHYNVSLGNFIIQKVEALDSTVDVPTSLIQGYIEANHTWQPIANAPVDDVVILGCDGDDDVFTCKCTIRHARLQWVLAVPGNSDYPGAGVDPEVFPLYWMPCPKPYTSVS
jgi:hypothetical protein